MKIAAAYIRVSTDDQLEYSPDSQLIQIRKYTENNNIILPDEFIFREDEGISGKVASKRPEFMRMIKAAKKKPKPFDIIVVWKFSRFARNRRDSIVYKSILRKQCGIDVVSVTEQLTDDKISIIVEAMIEAMDEYYSINLGEEVKRGMNEKVRRGEPVAAPAFGYLIKNKEYYINPDTAPIVKMMFKDFIGGMGCRSIASKLNFMEIRTKRGRLWENRTVEYILRNPVYIGKIRWNPKGLTGRNYDDQNIIVSEGRHEPIIDEDTWKMVQERFKKNKLMYGKCAGKKTSSEFMLQGLVKCSSCGASLTKTSGCNLQCQRYAHGKCKVSHFISSKKLENMVIFTITENLKYNKIYFANKNNANSNIENEIIEKQLIKEKQKFKRIKEAYQNGIDTLSEYKTNKHKIFFNIKILENKIESALDNNETEKYSSVQENVIKYLKDSKINTEKKNQLLRTFIDKIIYDKQKNKIEIYYYL